MVSEEIFKTLLAILGAGAATLIKRYFDTDRRVLKQRLKDCEEQNEKPEE